MNGHRRGRRPLDPLPKRLEYYTEVVNKVRELRKTWGYTQAQVAARLQVHRSYISLIETNRIPISLRHLRALAGIYEVLPQDLFGLLGLQEFDWVRMLASQPGLPDDDALATATAEERKELASYLAFLRWRTTAAAGAPGAKVQTTVEG